MFKDLAIDLSNLGPNGGILLVDKPMGWTSHDVVAWIRNQTGFSKVGHAGTLDPLATGLLIVLVGKHFTKKQREFLKLAKIYTCSAQFGVMTDTDDITGKVIKTWPWKLINQIDQSQMTTILTKFIGKIDQTVPKFSAVKVKGQKLYELARTNQILPPLPVRQVVIDQFKLIDFQKNYRTKKLIVDFNIKCSSGTYIRSLIHDLGKAVGMGAVVTALRRKSIGQFSLP